MIEGYVVLDKQFIYHDGCFSRIRYWIKGHHDLSSIYTTCRYINGYTGKETEVTINVVTPLQTFRVSFVQGVAA